MGSMANEMLESVFFGTKMCELTSHQIPYSSGRIRLVRDNYGARRE